MLQGSRAPAARWGEDREKGSVGHATFALPPYRLPQGCRQLASYLPITVGKAVSPSPCPHPPPLSASTAQAGFG